MVCSCKQVKTLSLALLKLFTKRKLLFGWFLLSALTRAKQLPLPTDGIEPPESSTGIFKISYHNSSGYRPVNGKKTPLRFLFFSYFYLWEMRIKARNVQCRRFSDTINALTIAVLFYGRVTLIRV